MLIRLARAAELPALQDIELAAGRLFRAVGMPEIAGDEPRRRPPRPQRPRRLTPRRRRAARTARVTNHVRPLSLTQARARGLITNAASAAVSCWTDNFYMAPLVGMSEGGSEDWCGNGSSITYAQSGNCYGTTSWPTWNYLGCSTTGYYGAGRNQAQQQVNWNMCTAWIPWPSNTCLHNQVNYLRLGFGPAGNVWTVSKGVL